MTAEPMRNRESTEISPQATTAGNLNNTRGNLHASIQRASKTLGGSGKAWPCLTWPTCHHALPLHKERSDNFSQDGNCF